MEEIKYVRVTYTIEECNYVLSVLQERPYKESWKAITTTLNGEKFNKIELKEVKDGPKIS